MDTHLQLKQLMIKSLETTPTPMKMVHTDNSGGSYPYLQYAMFSVSVSFKLKDLYAIQPHF